MECLWPSDASSGFYPQGMQADYALPFSLSGLWKRKADVLPPETLHQLEMMRRAEEIRQGNAHVKENIEEQRQKASKPKPASRKRRAAARAQQQERAAEDKQRRSAAAAKEKIMSADV